MRARSGILAPVSASVCFLWFGMIMPAFGQGGARWQDDQIPFGPEGTIGRGTDVASRPPYNIRGGFQLWPPVGFGLGGGVGSEKSPSVRSQSSTSGPAYSSSSTRRSRLGGSRGSVPYQTNQTYEPGDGYRYPLYYNPESGTYFYYPHAR